jgi:hypothetical protein
MADVVGTSQLSVEDRAALASYIKLLPPIERQALPRKQSYFASRRV